MKTVLTCFFVVSSLVAYSQSVSVFDIDASGFPTVKARFYAFDAGGDQARPGTADVSITENGTVRTVTSVSCPPAQPPRELSSVLVIDVSGSMSQGSVGSTNLDIAKAATAAWVNGLLPSRSECAITSFDTDNYLNQDFTTDSTKLMNSISSIRAMGGTDYDAGLINPMAGGLLVSKRGKHQKVIVFLTDGAPWTDPQVGRIVTEARSQGCIIYCVTVGMPAPQSLHDIASQTGGQVFENVTSVEQAEHVYRTILQIAQGSSPCTVEWQSDVSCTAGITSVAMQWQGANSSGSYAPPQRAVAELEVSPRFIAFGKRQPGSTYDTTITLTAKNADFTITGIKRGTGSTVFEVVNAAFPLRLTNGESTTVTLRYSPADSSRYYGGFEAETQSCSGYFSASGGFPGKAVAGPTLKLTHPNGGETFVVGSDTVITWSGISPSDTVFLDYSNDNGRTWKPLSSTASGLQHRWQKVPAPASSTYLVRVRQPQDGASRDTRTLRGHGSSILSVAFSPDGTTLASGSRDNTVILWDVAKRTKIRTLTGHDDWVWGVAFSPDGTTLASGSWDRTVILWDVATGIPKDTLTGHSDFVLSVAFSPDGTTLASGSADATVILWDVATGIPKDTLTGHSDFVLSVAFSPDGTTLASGSADATVILWDVATGIPKDTLTGHREQIWSVAISPGGGTLASGDDDNTIILWDVATGQPKDTLTGHLGWIWSVAFNPDGTTLASGSWDSTVILWDVATGIPIDTMTGHSDFVLSVAFSPDGTTLASGSSDTTVILWDVNAPLLQQDQSDAVFSVVRPQAASQNVSMGKVLVATAKDSVVSGFIRNTGSWKFRVDSLYFRGADAGAFTLVSGMPRYTVEAGSAHGAEFRFLPQRTGMHTAEIVIITQSDTLTQTITGEGVEPRLQIVNSSIDFDTVRVGSYKDTLSVVTIKNISNDPVTITSTKHNLPNAVDFSTRAGGGTFTLAAGEEKRMDLRFTPSAAGRTSGMLEFHYDGVGSPAIIQLYGEGTSEISGVNENPVTGIIRVYPNPTREQLHFSMPVTAQITDVLGQVHATLQNTTVANLSSNSRGIYFVRVLDSQGRITQCFKVIKE